MRQIRLLNVRTDEVDPKEVEKSPNWAHPFMVMVKALRVEADRLCQLRLPASFTGEIPDTPEAHAARAQLYMAKNGVSYNVAWEKTKQSAK